MTAILLSQGKTVHKTFGIPVLLFFYSEFLRRCITAEETWIYHCTPETKEQSTQWVFEGERAPNKAKTVKSAGKVMTTVFWDAHGIVYTEYLDKR